MLYNDKRSFHQKPKTIIVIVHGGLDGKESTCNAGWSGKFLGEGNGYPLCYSCLRNSTTTTREQSLLATTREKPAQQ